MKITTKKYKYYILRYIYIYMCISIKREVKNWFLALHTDESISSLIVLGVVVVFFLLFIAVL